MNKQTIKDLDVKGKKVLVRVDFNVPLDEKQNVANDKRIISALPTVNYLLDNGARVILMSHLGRPKGKVIPELSLKPVAKRLSELLIREVKMMPDCIGEQVRQEISQLKEGEVALLENTRFHPEETKNDPEFAKNLAELADVFVNDAFGTAHRAHASNVGVAQYLPSAVGFLIEKEIKYLGEALESPERPFTAILGGAKASGKIKVIDNFLEKVDNILIGGAMMFTFLRAMNYQTGNSKVEEDKVGLAKELLNRASERKVNLVIPKDVVVADKFDNNAQFKEVSVDNIPSKWMGLDIGSKTIAEFQDIIKKSRTIVWNGPMGVFEMNNFAKGTLSVAKTLAEVDAVTIIGGGDSVSAVEKFGFADKMTHISTGGGASLVFLEGKELPGISAIQDK